MVKAIYAHSRLPSLLRLRSPTLDSHYVYDETWRSYAELIISKDLDPILFLLIGPLEPRLKEISRNFANCQSLPRFNQVQLGRLALSPGRASHLVARVPQRRLPRWSRRRCGHKFHKAFDGVADILAASAASLCPALRRVHASAILCFDLRRIDFLHGASDASKRL
jgi:hypothetical protein